MLVSDLITLVNKIQNDKHEGQTLEVKSAHGGCPKIYDTLSSFSNQSDGGTIVFGIDEAGGFAPVGVYDVQDLLHQAGEQCKQMQPEVRAVFSVCEIDGKFFVSMEIPSADIMVLPVYYKGAGKWKGSYVRVGDADERMSEYEIYSYDAYHRQIHDDLRISDAGWDSLDQTQIAQYLLNIRTNRVNIQNFTDEELLKLMGLIKDGKPTLTAVMCFSKYPQAVYPQLCVTAVLVPGTSMGDTTDGGQRFVANKRIEGNIAQMAEAAVNFVAMNMRESVAFKNGKRVDIPEYPIEAVREAVLNALVHRDYSHFTEGMPVRIEMYLDRLEITNAGGLYGAVDIDDLGRVHADTRNKTLISVLEAMRVIENRYSGIPTIRRKMKELGLPEPLFTDRKGLFKVTLFNGRNKAENKADDWQSGLLEFCSVPRSRGEIAEYMGKTQYYTMSRFVEPLVEKGLLLYTIPDKPKSSKQRYVTKNNK
ncbi:MAG: putative DNA binding domain-containing protein [Clostridia bacterium]|nr:putative DNA binding domain-containing protein [Clostridia bacterium]